MTNHSLNPEGVKPAWFFNQTQQLGRLTFSWLLKHYCGLQISGSEQVSTLPQCIFAPTHASHLDFWAVLEGAPRKLREKTYIAAAADYFFKSFWRRQLIRLFSYHNFAIQRRTASLQDYQNMRSMLQAGLSLLIFAEGTRSRDGRIQPFKPLPAMLAIDTQVPIVPVVIRGTQAALPVGKFWPRRRGIQVCFGKPLYETAEQRQSQQLLHTRARRLNQTLMTEIAGLSKKIA